MGHFDKLVATNVQAQQLDAEYVKREALPDALSAGAHTVTIAEIRNGILRMDPTADRAFTGPTAALAVAGCPGCAVGDSIDFTIINTGTAGADHYSFCWIKRNACWQWGGLNARPYRRCF